MPDEPIESDPNVGSVPPDKTANSPPAGPADGDPHARAAEEANRPGGELSRVSDSNAENAAAGDGPVAELGAGQENADQINGGPPMSNTIDQAELDALAGGLDASADEPLPASAASGAAPAVIGTVPVAADAGDAARFAAPEFVGSETAGTATSIDLLDDVELDVKIELGRASMYIEDVLKLGVGSVVELDKLAGDPVDIFVNERLIARGEVLVLNDNFCVRISSVHSPLPEFEHAR